MAVRLQELAALVESEYAGDASRLWSEATTGWELLTRVQALPGFGRQKAQIFVALLAKQLDVRPEGWEAGRRATTRWPGTGRSPTSWTPIRCRRCAPSSSRRRQQARAATSN